jgi:ISXO2-like transposase domain
MGTLRFFQVIEGSAEPPRIHDLRLAELLAYERPRAILYLIKRNLEELDEDRSFIGLEGEYNVRSVNHSAGEFVRRYVIHTNGIESVWALLKRQIIGIHHWISNKHLNRYISEMTWRFNRYNLNATDRMNEIFACVEGRLTYKAFIA